MHLPIYDLPDSGLLTSERAPFPLSLAFPIALVGTIAGWLRCVRVSRECA